MLSRLSLVVIFAAALPSFADQNQCASCHPAETKLHQQTRMARSMSPALASRFAQHAADHSLHESADGYEFFYAPVPSGLQVTVQRGKKSASGIIEWVLGNDAQGETPLVRVGKTIFESRVSYFSRVNQYGVTVDQPAGKSANAEAALGLKESNKDARSCLACHSTGGVSSDLEPVIPGVQCARCHAGAEEHARTRSPVGNPGKLSPRAQIEVCGQCHRITPPVDDSQLENVRFQPLRLLKSRCFASGKLACTTCHPAHVDAKRDNPAFYNERCQTCHSGSNRRHTDSRQTGDCIGCHMPAVQVHPALFFTDHYIRTVKKNDPVFPYLKLTAGR